MKSVSIPEGKEDVWKKFEEIATREKGKWGVSEMLLSIVEKYVKEHGDGNPQYTLDKDVVAFPTPWAPIGFSDLKPYSWKEDDDMISRLEKATQTLRLDRQKKRDAEMQAKGISTRV